VRTAEFFDGRRPVLLVPAYYDCPLLCTLVLNRVQKALNEMSWTLGQEFRVITFSFDHTNTTQQAREKQTTYLAGYGRGVPEAAGQPEAAWMFLTGDVENIRALTTAVGYHYKYLADAKEFSHPAAIIVLSPEGEVHNYIEKLDFSGTEVQLALAEAADGRVGTIFERIRHFCFRYDPKTGQYSADAFAIMQVGASLSAACLGGFIIYIARRRGGGARAEGSAGPRGQEVHA
jgi:protein SCO1/2